MINKLIKRFIYACKACFSSPTLYPSGRYYSFDVNACAENYIRNMEAARYYSSLCGSKYLNFLQPFNGGGKRRLSRFDRYAIAHIERRTTKSGDTELDLMKKFYDIVWEKVKDSGYVFNLRNILDGIDGEIYFDQTHCSDIGYDVIAKKIADEIIKYEEKDSL